jgi:chromosome partitioning protein
MTRWTAPGLGWPPEAKLKRIHRDGSTECDLSGRSALGWPDATTPAPVSRETAAAREPDARALGLTAAADDDDSEWSASTWTMPMATLIDVAAGNGHGHRFDRVTQHRVDRIPDQNGAQVAEAQVGWGTAPGGQPADAVAPSFHVKHEPTIRTAAEIAAPAQEAGYMDDTPIATAARTAVAVMGGRITKMPRPAERRVMVVANQKGGVGKTTSTVNLAAALALHGNRVLVIDLDPQGNASTALGVDHHAEVPSIYDVLVEGRPLTEIVQPVEEINGLLCAPATIDLAGAEIELVSLVARESRLQRAIEAYDDDIDYILIDCPPSLGLLTVNALVAGREVLIPIQCEYYALEGLGQLIRNVELVKAHLNPQLHVSAILLTMYDARTRLAHQVAEEVRTHFRETVLRTTIPRSVRISEAPSYGQTVMTYDAGSTGALSYLEAAREMAQRTPAPPTGTVPPTIDGPAADLGTRGSGADGHRSPTGGGSTAYGTYA